MRNRTNDEPARNPALRADYILHELARAGKVTVDQLSARLSVDASTIRRDLEKLERQKLLKRVHGGAVPLDLLTHTVYAYNLTFQENSNRQVEEKASIALAAAQMIQPGDSIVISPGTSTTQLARAIRQLQIQSLTVVTSAVNIALELAGLPGVHLIVTGGLLLPDFFALVGPMAEQSLREMYFDKAFIGVTGLSPEQGLTGPNQLEALTFRIMIERARQTVVLADHTKLGRVALWRIAPVSAVHTLISDQAAPPAILQAVKAQGVNVVVA